MRDATQRDAATTNFDVFLGLINNTNVTLKSDVSGVLGLGFPRLSQMSSLVASGTNGENEIGFGIILTWLYDRDTIYEPLSAAGVT